MTDDTVPADAVDVDVPLSLPVVAAVAFRLGVRHGRGESIDAVDVDGLAMEHATARERFVVGDDDELAEWLQRKIGVPVEE
jgi:hypothetical protein